LNSNVNDWKKEIETMEKEIHNKREILNKERILLTDELILDREEDLLIEEEEVYKYKHDRFGPNGDFILQKKQLIQPIQDQIFVAIQEIAKTRKYDFIFDKSADIVMLYSDKRFDLSEQILRTILRANNQNKIESRKDKKKLEKESIISDSGDRSSREIELEKRKKLAEEMKNRIMQEKEAKRIEADEKKKKVFEEKELKKFESEQKIKKLIEEREKEKNRALEEKKKKIEEKEKEKKIIELERKKSLEEKKRKILEARKDKLDAKKIVKDSTFTNN
jgi:Skp family chaperone for outer membrane proteins